MQSKNLPTVCALLAFSILPAFAIAQTGPSFLPPVNDAAKGTATPGPAATPTPAARAALVQIADDNAHAAYQEGGFTGCSLAGVCSYTFSVVPANRRRLIEHFSCNIYVNSPGLLRYVALLSNTFSAPRDFVAATRSAADSGQWSVNNATLLHFDAGEAPLVYAYADKGPISDLTCTISGREIVVP